MFVSSTRARIAALLAQDLSMAEVARRTGLAYATVSYHHDRLRHDDVTRRTPGPVAPESALMPITTREEIHRMLRAGRSRADVARALGVSKSTVTYHARRLGMDIDARAARRYDWRLIQRHYDEGHTTEQCRAKFGFCKAAWSDAVRRGDIVSRASAMPIEELLAAPRGRANLKRRLIKAGLLAARCMECGIEEWRGLPLALELHHINGERHDNRLENLALLCPNCHSQTDTWGGRNGGVVRTSDSAADVVPRQDRQAA
jgi:DNA-binding CsgD family transcriptional regulator/5-methylcytosine-specific restriction endonuclease McrA